MEITSEMEEIIQYLHKSVNYALFAGFAAFLLTGVEPSFDIDVFVSSPDKVRKVTEDFIEKGWNLRQSTSNDFVLSTVEKNNTTFDIVFSSLAGKVFLPGKIAVSYKGGKLFAIAPEALLLTKMNQLTLMERSTEKIRRDQKVIAILRKHIDVEKTKELICNLDDSFWTEGHF